MRRISVVGCSGSGKSTLASALARRLEIPHVEIDAIRHQPNWRSLPDDELRARLGAELAPESWVLDGNLNDEECALFWPLADTVVWLDLPRSTVFRSVLGRTVRRGLARTELWNGNRERVWQLLDPRPEHNVVLWSWLSHPRLTARYEAAVTDPRWPHLELVRLRSRAEAAAWLEDATRA